MTEGPRPSPLLLFVYGLVIAVWSAMCGIGGGLFTVPFLHFWMKFPMRRAVATSLGLVFASTVFATLTEVVHEDSRLRWWLVAALIAGSLIGTQLGFRVAHRIDARQLKALFVVALGVVGVFVLRATGGGQASAVPNFEPTLVDHFTAFVIGFFGGFLAPIMGIGGGLVAVPALSFALSELGHRGARAISTAMAAVTSGRSFWLYLRAEEVRARDVAAIGMGGAIGASIGVQLVHVEGMADVARGMMGVTLLLVAARFAWDLRPGSR